MTELVLAHVDLARIRFAHSPVRELVASLGVLREPGRQYRYGTWLSDEFVKLYDEVLLPAQRQFGLDVLGRRSSSRRP